MAGDKWIVSQWCMENVQDTVYRELDDYQSDHGMDGAEIPEALLDDLNDAFNTLWAAAEAIVASWQ